MSTSAFGISPGSQLAIAPTAAAGAASSATDQSDVPALLQLVQQVLQKSYSSSSGTDGAGWAAASSTQLDASVGATALCLMGHRQPAAKVAGYLFYEWLVRGGPDRLAARDAIGVLGINAFRKDAVHASPAVRASVVRAAAAALASADAATAASQSRASDSGRSPDACEIVSTAREVLFVTAAADTSAFVRRAVAAAAPSTRVYLPVDERCIAPSPDGGFVKRLRALMDDSDPLVVVGALTSASTLRQNVRQESGMTSGDLRDDSSEYGIELDRCLRLLDDVASGAYPEFARVAALRLACSHATQDGCVAASRIVGSSDDEDDSLYDLLDRLDPLLQSQDPCLTLAAIEAFATLATRLPAGSGAASDAAARLADACLRLVAHPEPTVVAAVLGWLGNRSDLDRLASYLCTGGLSLFYCRPSDGLSLRRRKADILCRLASQLPETVADVASHLLSQLSPTAGSRNARNSSAAEAVAAAVARLACVDDTCRAACIEALERHVRSCDAAALAATAACWPTLGLLINQTEPPESSVGARLLQATAASTGLLAMASDADEAAVAAAVQLAADCCSSTAASLRDAVAVIAAAAERAFPEERPTTAAGGVAGSSLLMTSIAAAAAGTLPVASAAAAPAPAGWAAGGIGLRLAILSSAIRCYYRRPCAISRHILGRVLQAAVRCDCDVVREQAVLYYSLMQADTDSCRLLVLGTAQQQQQQQQ